MSTVTCPGGHASDATDYCSVCGVKMGGADAPVVAATPAPAPSGTVTCSNCGSSLDPHSRFCEVCGYDPSTGSLPEAPTPVPADPAPAGDVETAAGTDTAAAAAAPLPPPASGTWVALVSADRDYYDRNGVTEVQFPLGVPARSIELTTGQNQAIGRRSRSRGTDPEIDLAGPPEDAAVSHTHASLLPTDAGGWELVDHGSTNGTYLNESPHPVAANEPVPVAPGDRIYVGAWTKITLELQT